MEALDLFAGAGGWSVACRNLGIDEFAVENMKEAIATREANGFDTVWDDVWTYLEKDKLKPYPMVIASPPCPTFSMTGSGVGRKALDLVIALVRNHAFLDIEQLHEFGRHHDPRTALVLAAMNPIARTLPTYIAFEQVPPALPVWEACAEVLEEWGYSVATGVIDAVEYGVPQTRRRAVLVARADGEVAFLPTPTHSRYHRTKPEHLDIGMPPWISMREAMGWGSGVVGMPRLDDGRDPGVVIDGAVYRKRDMRETEKPSATITGKSRSWRKFIANDKFAHTAVRDEWQPAPTITGGHDTNNRRWLDGASSERVTVRDVTILQSFDPEFTVVGAMSKQYLQIANAIPPTMAQAVLSSLVQ